MTNALNDVIDMKDMTGFEKGYAVAVQLMATGDQQQVMAFVQGQVSAFNRNSSGRVVEKIVLSRTGDENSPIQSATKVKHVPLGETIGETIGALAAFGIGFFELQASIARHIHHKEQQQ